MEDLIAWLSHTQAYSTIRDVVWIIPTVQSIHILAISVVMASVLLLNLRLVGLIGGGEAKDVFTRRYLPWVWTSLLILLASGTILVIGEPERDLQTPVFWLKMSLIVSVVILTLILERPILRNADFWETPGRKLISRLLATVSLAGWVGIVLCGRWIAYSYGI